MNQRQVGSLQRPITVLIFMCVCAAFIGVPFLRYILYLVWITAPS